MPEEWVRSVGNEVDVAEQVEAYFASQSESKQADLRRLHADTLAEFPDCRLWFDDGIDARGKVVANPSIGYGQYTITYANGSSREFYRVGFSANTAGISVYVMGLEDKAYLKRTFGPTMGAANITSYCIKFKSLAVISPEFLYAAMRHGMTRDKRS